MDGNVLTAGGTHHADNDDGRSKMHVQGHCVTDLVENKGPRSQQGLRLMAASSTSPNVRVRLFVTLIVV